MIVHFGSPVPSAPVSLLPASRAAVVCRIIERCCNALLCLAPSLNAVSTTAINWPEVGPAPLRKSSSFDRDAGGDSDTCRGRSIFASTTSQLLKRVSTLGIFGPARMPPVVTKCTAANPQTLVSQLAGAANPWQDGGFWSRTDGGRFLVSYSLARAARRRISIAAAPVGVRVP
jgi:hypothetical protein